MTKPANFSCVTLNLIKWIKDEGIGKYFWPETLSAWFSEEEDFSIFYSCYSWEFVDGRSGMKMKSCFVNTIIIDASL